MKTPLAGLLLVTMLGAGITGAATTPIRVACVGDSITAGAKIGDATKNYPAQLGIMLGNGYEVRNFGVKTTTVLRKAKPWRDKKAFECKPDNVVIKPGTNDSKEEFWKHKADFEPDYIALIKRFQDLESKPRVLICYPVPCYKDLPIRDKVITGEIIPLITEVARKMNVEVIDLHKPLTGKQDLFADGVHPNADGAKIIAETVKQRF